MDISLNVTTAAQPIRSKVLKSSPAKPVKRSAGGSAASNGGFSFQFGGSTQKVKAIVARRRPLAKSAPTTPTTVVPQPSLALKRKSVDASNELPRQPKSPLKPLKEGNVKAATPSKSVALKRKAAETPQAERKCFVLAPPPDSGGPTNVAPPVKVEKEAIGNDLMLNICSIPAAARAPPKWKPSRAERLSQKRQSTAEQPRTQPKLAKTMRRNAVNPNQLPRAGDLLQQREEQEQQQQAAEQEPSAQLVRKPNAFRMHREKKLSLFEKNPEAKPLGQRLVKPIKERIFDGTKVETLGLHAHAVKNLTDLLSISELTTVQRKTIPQALEGKDLLVRSQTGSGKTLAYALPVVEKLQEIRPQLTREDGIMAVVIVPTRELAIQTYELFQKLVKPFTWLVPGVLMGGERRKAEKARLRKGINILVGTPGRLVDHLLHTESFKLNKAKFLVLDEADRLLEMGYERDVKQIVEAIDKQRAQLAEETKIEVPHLQRLLLSATLTAAVQKLAGLTLQQPTFIDNSDEDPDKAIRHSNGYTKEAIEAATEDLLPETVAEDEEGILTIPENLQLTFLVVPPKLRLVTLCGLLAKEYAGKSKWKALIFMSTTEMVGYHHDLLNETLTQKVLDEDDEEAAKDGANDSTDGEKPLLKGLRFFKLYGSMTQTERQGVFKSFRECQSGVLLATDVVGRGIDVPDIDLVVQYSPPQKTADFVHRVGRTARAGRSGRAILFLAPSEAQFVRFLENRRIRISQGDADNYLNALVSADAEARNMQEAASNLQHKFQELISEDAEMHEKACKAFVSWMKFLSTFPRELKPIFSIKNSHMGHYAKSFALRDEPTSFAKKHSQPKPPPATNRLTYTERDPEKIKQEKRAKRRQFGTTVKNEVRSARRPASTANRLVKMLPHSRSLTTSEFDSGLPPPKKRK